MIKNYIVPILRHLWRHRLFTLLNILGLSIGICTCWVIFRIVDYEFSYDRGLDNRDNIYRVVTGFIFNEKESYNGGVSAPLYQGIRQQVSGIKYTVPVLGIWLKAIQVNSGNAKPLIFEEPSGIAATDSTYFNMIPYKWIVGNKSKALNAPENVVLTESRAKKYFPGKKPGEIINHTLTYYSYRDTLQKTITGIVADLNAPTEFTTQEFCSLPTKAYELNAWTNTNGSDKLYLQLNMGANPDKILGHIETIVKEKVHEFERKEPEDFKYKRWNQLLPLKESHFSTYIEEYQTRKANKKILYGLIGVGLFLLILACINYINMSVAGMPQRAKEIGVRKTLGSNHAQLIGQFLSETLLTTFIAAIFAHALSFVGFWLLKEIIPPGVTPLGNTWQLIFFIMVVSVLVTLLAGLYPGWLITKVKTVNIFRNFSAVKNVNSTFSLQKVLIVFQFVIALVFITSSLIVGRQLHYILTADMGFKKDAVVLVDIPWKYVRDKKYEDRQFALYTELKTVRGIESISLGTPPMSDNRSSGRYQFREEPKEPISREVSFKWVDTAYLNVYDIKLLAGRNIHASDTTNELVINETALHQFGFKYPQEAIGKLIGQPPTDMYPIVGVVKDFHLQDFYSPIDPMAFQSEKDQLRTLNIKLSANDMSQWQLTLKTIERKWQQFYPPESFSYKFYDETIESMYEQERHLAKLINLATGIAIFISCLGLFGLAVLTAVQRTKEIGIRKVLGASVSGIVQLLSREYLRLVIISIILASPIAWWAMNKWLQNFAFRIHIQWWMFFLANSIGLAIAMITVSFQAVKAATANPVKSLRTE